MKSIRRLVSQYHLHSSFAAFPSRSVDFSGLATVKTKKRLVSDKGLELLEDLNEVNILNVTYVITLFSWDKLKV